MFIGNTLPARVFLEVLTFKLAMCVTLGEKRGGGIDYLFIVESGYLFELFEEIGLSRIK